MALYVLRRLVLLIVACFVTTIIVFLLLRLLPGDLALVVGGTEATPDRIEAIRQELGLDRPLVAQYFEWLGGALTGDFGTSALSGETVTSELGEKLMVTAPLVLASTVLSVIVAVPLGVVAGARHRKPDGVALVGGQPARHRPAVVLGGPDADHPVRRPAPDLPGTGLSSERLG